VGAGAPEPALSLSKGPDFGTWEACKPACAGAEAAVVGAEAAGAGAATTGFSGAVTCWFPPACWAAEELDAEGDGGFNPRVRPMESERALAPEGSSSVVLPEAGAFSPAP
jgi:hypothetical protein